MSVLNRMYTALVVAQEVVSGLRDADGAHSDVTPLNTAGRMLDDALALADAALKIKTVIVGRVEGEKQTFSFCTCWAGANEQLKEMVSADINAFSFRRTYSGSVYKERAGSVIERLGQQLVDVNHYVSEMIFNGRVMNIGGHPQYPLFLCPSNNPEMVELIECQEALAICKEVDMTREEFFTNGVRVRYYLSETDVAIPKIGERP